MKYEKICLYGIRSISVTIFFFLFFCMRLLLIISIDFIRNIYIVYIVIVCSCNYLFLYIIGFNKSIKQFFVTKFQRGEKSVINLNINIINVSICIIIGVYDCNNIITYIYESMKRNA